MRRASSSRSSRSTDGARLYLIADGRLVNLSAAEGHPALVMDMSFANQALSAEYAVQNAAELERKVYPVPDEIDKEIARLKLDDDGRRDRQAHGGAGEVPRLVGRRNLDSKRHRAVRGGRPEGRPPRPAPLPDEEVELECRSAAEVVTAIRELAVRGAPAIGIAAAYGLALAAERGEDLDEAERVLARVAADRGQPRLGARPDARRIRRPAHARALHADEVERCHAMAAHAAELFAAGTRALTHCNAGGLATGGYGTRRRRAAHRVASAGCSSACLGGRDAAAAAGRAADGLGARSRRHPAHRDRRLRRGVADGRGRGGLHRHRRRPHRRERRHREQDRHVLSRRARAPTTGSRSTSSRRRRPSISRRRPARGSRSRSATPPRSRRASPPGTRPSTSRRPS